MEIGAGEKSAPHPEFSQGPGSYSDRVWLSALAKNKESQEKTTTIWFAAAKIVDSLLDKFGWPGLLVLFVMYLVAYRASEDQVHALIDMYLLGRGIGNIYPTIVMAVIFLGVLFAQRHLYKRKENQMLAELARIGAEKSKRQEAALGVKLHHSPERSS